MLHVQNFNFDAFHPRYNLQRIFGQRTRTMFPRFACISPVSCIPPQPITILLLSFAKLACQGLHRRYTAHFVQRLLVACRSKEKDVVISAAKRSVVSISLSGLLQAFCGGITVQR